MLSPTPSPSRPYQLCLPPAVTQLCNQALAFTYIRRIGLDLLLFHGTLLVRLLVIPLANMDSNRMLYRKSMGSNAFDSVYCVSFLAGLSKSFLKKSV